MLAGAYQKARDGLLAIAYPEQCRVCGDNVESWDDGVACARCWIDPTITRFFFDEPVCEKCGSPLAEQISRSARFCGNCYELPFFAVRACGAYSGALKASILFLKSHPHICHRLRQHLARLYLQNVESLASDVVIPVPLHRARERERGFNQAFTIARAITSQLDLYLNDYSLARIKDTQRHRTGMDAIDRARSIKRAFKVMQPELIAGKTVLVVDDLYTTGSTLSAVACELLEAGAQRVNVLTLARVTGRANARGDS